MSFHELIGNEKIKQNLIKIVNTNTISHSYMFIGTKGIGKKLFAKEFAKGILCSSQEQKPCENCKSCLEFVSGNHPDYDEIGLEDEENSIKIDTIRQMQKKVQELPIVSSRKVYIIDDSEYMTKDAQNCLLKTLEEPPSFVTIILIVSNENSLLNTIKSRCIKLYFNDLTNEELEKYLQENYSIHDFETNLIQACQGSIGRARQIYNNKEMYQQLDTIFNNIEQYSLTQIYSKLDVLYKNKEEIQEILAYLNTIFIKKAKDNIKYTHYIQMVEETKQNIHLNCNYDMCIDKLLFTIFSK